MACGCSSSATARPSTYSAGAEVDERALLETAPDLDIAGNRVRLDGLRYRIELALPERQPASSTLDAGAWPLAAAGRHPRRARLAERIRRPVLVRAPCAAR